MIVVRVAVVGAGVAGSAAALLLARGGHDVVLVDPSGPPAASAADDVFDTWERPGVGQFQQPHNFLGRARAVLRDHLPDVYASLLSAGATEVDMATFLGDAQRQPGDEDLATVACRRPAFDAALRAALSAQAGVDARVTDVVRLISDGPRVTGVGLTDGSRVEADLVVDASGRGPHTARWLEEAGLRPWREGITDCGLLYYSRHYRLRDGATMPPYASLLGGPRGDLGYLAYAVFLGDNDTFCLCVMVPTTERAWRDLREPQRFERVARALPGMASWLDATEPVSPVLPMGALRNTLRHPVEGDRPTVMGFVSLGDARCHTNPTFAFGASLSLAHAVTLTEVVATAQDHEDLALRFEDLIGDEARERFAAVGAEDEERRRIWGGEPVDPTDREQAPAMFLRSVVYRCAPGDPELLRAVARRVNALDPVDALAQRTDLLDRAAARFDEIRSGLPAPPAKGQLLAALSG